MADDGKGTRIVHVKIFDATQEDMEIFKPGISSLKDKLPFDTEFVVTNDKIEVQDIKHLIKELYDLYNKYKKLKEDSENED